MNRIRIWVAFIMFFLLIHTESSIDQEVRNSLFNFYSKLSNTSGPPDPGWGWNLSSDPCLDNWRGVICDNRNSSVKRINLGRLNFTGTFDPSTLCSEQSLAESLTVIHLDRNSLRGENLEGIADCRQLTHLYIGGNQFSGTLPESLSRLNNLKVLDISGNNFSGSLPDLTRISGLQELFAQNNQLTGPIPNFGFSNFDQFNVSFNSFTGPIPEGARALPDSSFIGNPELCGEQLPKQCSSSEPNPKKKSKNSKKFLMYAGYLLVGLVVIVFVVLKLCKRKKTKEGMVDAVNKASSFDDSSYKPSIIQSVEYKAGLSKSEVSAESGMASASLIVLTSPRVNGLKFEDLLKAPAELLGRGKHGTVYKVICEQGVPLTVKRIRDWAISCDDFKQRMRRLDQIKHPNVLPAIAFYCSKYEKLLVYEYQENGSLFKLLHGTEKAGAFDWSSRLGIAVSVSQTLAFMHQELHEDGIAHGNLKSSNILLNKNMEPIISEYGLMMIDDENQSILADFDSRVGGGASSAFKADIYGLGVILLELLTGKLVQNDGLDLASWVLAVVREEWTVEVFARSLIQEGASEERMVNLLQIAVKCVNMSPEARPSVNQVALMINTIKEEEERSTVSEP